MNCFAQSDRGTVRKENQDRAACAHIRRKGCTVAVVCDGMGGAAGGKLASDLAASTFLADFRREMMVGSAVEPAMRHACDAANRAIYDRACTQPDLRGMGTTIVAACVRHGRLTVLHVGDSRAYLAGLRRMQQLTTDHSLVQELVASGQVLPEQAHMTLLDVIFTQTRHIMYNVGYCNGILRERNLPESDWYAYNETEE